MKPLIVALDVDTEKEALALVKSTRKHADIYKVGPSLILRYGPSIFQKIKRFGKKIFLDLKFHDIPNTMFRAIQEVAKHNVFSATVHISAGEYALKTVSKIRQRPLLWGVTVLTSLTSEDLQKLGFRNSTLEHTNQLAFQAKTAGLDGVVASVGETAALRSLLGKDFQIITPGIRMPGDEIGDQRRIATPSHAKEAGATFFVVGRPILESKNPEDAAEMLLRDWRKC